MVLLAVFAIMFSLNSISVLIPLIIIIILIAAAGASMRGSSILGAFGIASIAGVRLGKGSGRPLATNALKRHRLFVEGGFYQKAVYARLDKNKALKLAKDLHTEIVLVTKSIKSLKNGDHKRKLDLEKKLQGLLDSIMALNLRTLSVNPELATLAGLNAAGTKGKTGRLSNAIGLRTNFNRLMRRAKNDKTVQFKDAQEKLLHDVKALIKQYSDSLGRAPKGSGAAAIAASEFGKFLAANNAKMEGYINGTPVNPDVSGGIVIASFFMRERNLAANRKKQIERLMTTQDSLYSTEKEKGTLLPSKQKWKKTEFGPSGVSARTSIGMSAASKLSFTGKLGLLNRKERSERKESVENAAILSDKKFDAARKDITNKLLKDPKFANVFNVDGSLNKKDKNTKDFIKQVRNEERAKAKGEIDAKVEELTRTKLTGKDLKDPIKVTLAKAAKARLDSAQKIEADLTAEFKKEGKVVGNYNFNNELNKRLKSQIGFNPNDAKQTEAFAKSLLINQVASLKEMKDKFKATTEENATKQIENEYREQIIKLVKDDVSRNYKGPKEDKYAAIQAEINRVMQDPKFQVDQQKRVKNRLEQTANKIAGFDLKNDEDLTAKAAYLLSPKNTIRGSTTVSSETKNIVSNLERQATYEKFSDITMTKAIAKREEFLDKQGAVKNMAAANTAFWQSINTMSGANENKERQKTQELLSNLKAFDKQVMKNQPRTARMYSGKEYYFEEQQQSINQLIPNSKINALNSNNQNINLISAEQKEAEEKANILRQRTTSQSKASISDIPGNQGPTPPPAQPPSQQKPQPPKPQPQQQPKPTPEPQTRTQSAPKSEPVNVKAEVTSKASTPSTTQPKSEQQVEQIQPKPQRPQLMPEQTLKTLESKVKDELLSMHVNAYATSNESNSDAVQNLVGRIDSAISATGLKSNKDVSTKIAQDLLTQAKSRELNDKDVAEAIAKSQASVPTPPRQEPVPPQPEIAPKPTIPPREEIKVPSSIRSTATETVEQEVQQPKQEVLQEIQSSVTNFKPTEDEGSQALLAATIKQKLESVGMAASQEELNKAAADILPIITSRSKKKKAKIEQTLSNWLDELMGKP